MATEKPRINITTEVATHKALAAAAKRDGVPLATKAADLLELALELEEDLAFADIAIERLKDGSKFIPHEDAWL